MELDAHFPQSKYMDASKIGFINDFKMGVRDFIYLPEYQSAFVACSEMNIVHRLDSYFTNYTMPWEKGSKKQ
jgi:hypothetical protein